jgi:hypothetical protein
MGGTTKAAGMSISFDYMASIANIFRGSTTPMGEFSISNKMTTNRLLLRLVLQSVRLLAIQSLEQSILTNVSATTSSEMVESSLLAKTIAALPVLVTQIKSAELAIG